MTSYKLATKVIHEGYQPEPLYGSIMPPIYMTSTFAQDAPGQIKGYDYTRAGNPNFTALEEMLASIEEAKYATVFSSGLGALTAMVSTLKPGDKVYALDGVYGGTYRLFTKIFQQYGIEFVSFRINTLEELDHRLSEQPKWLFFETPTNPLLEVFDIEAFSQLAKKHDVLTIVDNTFSTPYFQNPMNLGADIVWHSTTKYISGHSDVIGGVAMTNDKVFKEALDFGRMAIGLNPSPFDVWLIMRGAKTLALRMQRHEENAIALADYFHDHPKVANVYYPNNAIARKQMRGFGGIVSVEFKMSLEETKEMISSYKLFTLAESLGGVESLVCQPATMTHASIPPDERERIGLADGLVRFSVGIEDSEDLIQDIDSRI